MAGLGEVCPGEVRHGKAWQAGRVLVRRVQVRCAVAGPVMAGLVRQCMARFGSVCLGRQGKSCLGVVRLGMAGLAWFGGVCSGVLR